MTYGAYGSRKDLWEDSNYTNIKSDMNADVDPVPKNHLTCCEKCFQLLWCDLCRPVACAKSCVDTVGNPAKKSTGRCTYHLWPQPKNVHFPCRSSMYKNHIQPKTCIPFSQSLQLTSRGLHVQSFCNTWMIVDDLLMSGCSWMPNVGEVRSNLMPSSCTNTSGRYSIDHWFKDWHLKVTEKNNMASKRWKRYTSLKDLDFTMINLPFLRETELLSPKSQVTYHQQSQLWAWVACMCYDLRWWHKTCGVQFPSASEVDCNAYLLKKYLRKASNLTHFSRLPATATQPSFVSAPACPCRPTRCGQHLRWWPSTQAKQATNRKGHRSTCLSRDFSQIGWNPTMGKNQIILGNN